MSSPSPTPERHRCVVQVLRGYEPPQYGCACKRFRYELDESVADAMQAYGEHVLAEALSLDPKALEAAAQAIAEHDEIAGPDEEVLVPAPTLARIAVEAYLRALLPGQPNLPPALRPMTLTEDEAAQLDEIRSRPSRIDATKLKPIPGQPTPTEDDTK